MGAGRSPLSHSMRRLRYEEDMGGVREGKEEIATITDATQRPVPPTPVTLDNPQGETGGRTQHIRLVDPKVGSPHRHHNPATGGPPGRLEPGDFGRRHRVPTDRPTAQGGVAVPVLNTYSRCQTHDPRPPCPPPSLWGVGANGPCVVSRLCRIYLDIQIRYTGQC